MKSLPSKVVLVFLFSILLVSFASAFEFDNVKNFEKKAGDRYGFITITNAYGFGSDLAKYELLENTDQCLTQCEAKLSITLYSAGTLIDALKMKSSAGVVLGALPGQKTLIKTGEEEYTVDEVTYETICTPALLPNGKPYSVCQQVPTKTTKVTKTRDVYTEYVGQAMPAGTYTFKIVAKKEASQSVDWIATGFGKEMTEWAWWIGVSPSAYWKFNESTPNTAANLVDAAVVMTKVNTPLTVTGKLGNGVNTTYTSSANSMNTSVAGSYGNWTFGTGNLTICYWGNVPPTGGGGSRLHVSAFGTGGWADSNSWAMSINPGGEIAITGTGAQLGATSGLGINDGSWHRVCWIRAGSANRLYSDGVNKANFTNSNDFSASKPIGVSPAGAGGGDTTTQKGMIDDLQIFKGYAWSVADVIADYNGGAGKEGDITQGTTSITLNKPSTGSVNSSSSQFFNATITSANAFNQNVTFYLYNATSQALIGLQKNTTLDNSKTTAEVYFINASLPDGSYKWNVLGCSNGSGLSSCAFGAANFTFSIDTTSPVVTLTAPSGIINYHSTGRNLTVTYSVTETNSASCWLVYNGLNQNVSCSGTTSTLNVTSIANKTAQLFANDTVGNIANATIGWDYIIFEHSRFANDTTVETASESFTSNVTYLSSNYSSISGVVGYIATNYTASGTATGTNYVSNKILDVPAVGIATNNITWGWNVVNTTNTYLIPGYLSSQNCVALNFTFCQATPLNNSFLNISFRDEVNSSNIAAKVDASTFYYYLGTGTGTVNKTYTYSNSVGQNNYSFCATPANRTLTTVISNFRYSNTNYPQRIYNDQLSLSVAGTNKILYLLNSADGQYTTFQVLNSAGNPISGATVTINRTDLGSYQTGTTDSSGTITFWVNPNYPLAVVASSAAYGSTTLTITPTLTQYTITIGSATVVNNITDTSRGVTYTVLPASRYLSNNTSYTFVLNLTSSYWVLSSWGMNITNASGSLLMYNVSTSGAGGNLYAVLNTNNLSSITMYPFWIANSTYRVDGPIIWKVSDNSGTQWSLTTFRDDLQTYLVGTNGVGLFGLTTFGLNMLIFLFIICATGIVSYKFGLSSSGVVIGMLWSLTAFFDIGLGLITGPSILGLVSAPTLILTIIGIGYIVNERFG